MSSFANKKFTSRIVHIPKVKSLFSILKWKRKSREAGKISTLNKRALRGCPGPTVSWFRTRERYRRRHRSRRRRYNRTPWNSCVFCFHVVRKIRKESAAWRTVSGCQTMSAHKRATCYTTSVNNNWIGFLVVFFSLRVFQGN